MAIKFKSAIRKYMLYRSETKLDMLYEQIATSASEKRSIEWSANVPFLKLTRKSEEEHTVVDRDDMLKTVIEEIEASGQVGTVDEPNEYIKGTLPGYWGGIDDWGRPSGEAPLVYFGGFTERTVFGLGGSMKHVIGMAGMGNTGSRSHTPFLVRHLVKGLELAPDGWRAAIVDEDDGEALQAVAYATHMLRKGSTKCALEFFAKTLLVDRVQHDVITNGEDMGCILGTPLYVALASRHPDELRTLL